MQPRLALLFLLAAMPLATTASAQDKKSSSPPTLAERVAGMKHTDGFLPLDWDAKAGKLYLEIPKLGPDGHSADMLYTTSLPWGMGSNDVGLDRGQTGRSSLVRFERTGPKVLLVEPNLQFRAGATTDAAEAAAVTTSFPQSVLAGFKVEAEDAASGTVLLDATDFFLRDAHGVSEALERAKQGNYKVDAMRSTIALDNTKAFPRNTEVEAELTFTSEGGRANFVRDVTPDAKAMTVRERQSFVELPPLDGAFQPRRYNPRAGYFDASYRNLNVPLGDDMTQRFIERHRLIKKDPRCEKACEAVAPIQYYVDRGAPEPIRSALVEGARWWDDAFQAAGWTKGTFRVDVLPADADPMDVRYNIIQWVHRYTRGWSYGATITDPRTGEILKSNVTLGSLRGRQDYMIAEALLAPYGNKWFDDIAAHMATYPSREGIADPMLTMVLQRIRQLSAHETGHTLGLAHNFAASSFKHENLDQTISVMDYPHPYITLDKNGTPDLSHAYPVGIGLWDKVAINYGYREFDRSLRDLPTLDHKPVPANVPLDRRYEDSAALHKILADADEQGLVFLTDQDARPFSSVSPINHLWDNGPDATAELNRILDVRAAALKRFGENNIRPGTPMSQLADTLVPLYLLHRYQTEAAIKLVGGVDFRYNLRGDGQPGPVIVGLKQQDAALDAVLKTLSPDTLTLPESILKLIPPTPPGYPRSRESFPSETGSVFDPVAAAEAAADLTLQVLFDPARASRLLEFHMRDTADGAKGPSLRVMMEKVSKATAERTEGGHTISSEVMRAVEFRGLEWMLGLAVNPQASSQARAIALYHIDDLLKQWTTEAPPADSAEAIHREAMVERIRQFKQSPEKFVPAKPVEAPPGMPIGDEEVM